MDCLNQIARELTCQVCLQLYSNPLFLDCYHIYCSNCIQQLIDWENWIIRCPSCRRETFLTATEEGDVTELQAAFLVQNILDHMNKAGVFLSHPSRLEATEVCIKGVEHPWGIAVTKKEIEEVIAVENGGDCVSMFDLNGEKLRTFGTPGSCEGQFDSPRGVAVDRNDHILVADEQNHRIQHFTKNGSFIKAVGTRGCGPLQFEFPYGIAVHPHTGEVYVTEIDNHRVQVLTEELQYSHSFGERGRGDGEFECPSDVSCSADGRHVYVTDRHCTQAFTADGTFLHKFREVAADKTKMLHPAAVCVSSDGMVCVSGGENKGMISFFGSNGLSLSLAELECKGLCHTQGMTFERSGKLWVSHSDQVQCYLTK